MEERLAAGQSDWLRQLIYCYKWGVGKGEKKNSQQWGAKIEDMKTSELNRYGFKSPLNHRKLCD